MLVIADSDSYVKWGAALAARLPADWTARVVVLRSPVMPSPRQLRIALKGTGFAPEVVGGTAVDDLVTLIAADEPDAVLLSLRGPLVRVVSPLIMRMPNRPVLLSGFPGITIPAERKAVIFRELVDLIVLHSRREVRDFSANAADLGVDVAFGLATFPFLASVGSASAIRNAVVFAAQAKVPAEREDRIRLLGWLADAARAQPEHRVVVKVRAIAGEAQTHREEYGFAELLSEPDVLARLAGRPANLVVEDGPMAEHLAQAAALVTISSTAALEAIALGVPVVMVDDFGVDRALINTVFDGSGLLASSRELIAGRYRHPDPAWLDDNYFHGDEFDDWASHLNALADRRAASGLPQRTRVHNLTGGALRSAYERRRVLGTYDTGTLGAAAAVIGAPVRWTLRRGRKALRMLLGAREDAAPLELPQPAGRP